MATVPKRPARLVLSHVGRDYHTDAGEVAALRDISLAIEPGEFVAIIGASGSGKSTLLNIIGCLDQATSGTYAIGSEHVASLDADQLAALRRAHFGFIFQRYHLLGDLSAAENTEMPSIYAGIGRDLRQNRAERLLDQLGLGDRLMFRPSQLSGGQQQRVSIARALMNDADVILADEPTGSLDRASGEEVLATLTALNRAGRTIILVTHDMAVARHAGRIIEISDGRVIADRRNDAARINGNDRRHAASRTPSATSTGRAKWLPRQTEAFAMAAHALMAHRLRTLLTMLGIIIGIASVIIVVAIGEGARRKVLSDIASLGTNTLEVFPGRDFGDRRSDKVRTLTIADAEALARQPYLAGATPTLNAPILLRSGSRDLNAQINGVGADFFAIKGLKLASGRIFRAEATASLAPEVVIDENTRAALADTVGGDLIGRQVLVGPVPVRIVGILEKQREGFGAPTMLSVYMPHGAAVTRLTGPTPLRSLLLRVPDHVDPTLAQQAVARFLKARHGSEDFFIINTDDIRRTIGATAATLTLFIAAIAVVSLVVGGIGVMNIMLVAVSERVTEIGVRMAVGARRGDILRQFLTEAVLISIAGGVLGIGLALTAGYSAEAMAAPFPLVYSPAAMLIAVAVSTGIGVVFGYLPARRAALLDPVAALAAP